MLNIRHISVLLVLIFLLFLFINCDSRSKAGAGTNTGAGGGAGSGINTRPEPNTEVEVGDEEALAYLEEKVTDSKLKALLDQFGVSEAGRKAIGYIQGILRVSYKNGFDDKFYNCLNQLGADVVIEEIIKPTVSLLRARGEALRVIEGTTDEGVKTRLQDMLSSCDNVISFAWNPDRDHLIFNEDKFANAVNRYTPKFSKFKEMVKNPRVKDIYVWLDADEQATIDEIGNIVISTTYDKDKFNNVLNSVSDYHVVKIISFCRLVKKMQEEALNAIEGVSDDAEKQKLQVIFNRLKDEYNSHIRDTFNQSSDKFYAFFIKIIKYSNGFSILKEDAKKAVLRAAAAAKASGAAGGSS
ncbi:BTA121 domain-containing protein surface lipoprotein [Borrelia turicatae]|uniref:Lipoprotein n=1 Tax=Borrelia turicatae (strain 91E135) TaxID=314724 RepID=A0A0R9PUL0_BORT9|nr:hypothetical protein [Borrelia turicatae]ALC78614.1 hypothetical protein BTA127 [Borrelia turicatae 91E135]UPA14050.1 hypothetical protein bt91E135_001216 [Borrelia turicatae 91E135]